MPVALFGYPGVARRFDPRGDRSIDGLQARAVYLQQGAGPGLLLLSMDLCILLTRDARAVREEIAAAVHLPVEHVIVACTHTHSGPFVRFLPDAHEAEPEAAFTEGTDQACREYGAWLRPRLVRIARLAVARRSPVTLAFRETCTGLGYDRRCRTADGIRHCWNPAEFPDRIPAPARGARHGVLRADFHHRTGGVLLQSVAIHPVVMGKGSSRLSADWPGAARRHLERRIRRHHAVVFQGAAAQVQPWLSTQEDPRAVRLVGEAIGAEAVLLATAGQPLPLPREPLQPAALPIPGRSVEVTACRIGRLLLLALPFELSCTWAQRIAASADGPVLFICLANGWDGYWMAPEEFAEGGYEIEVARSKGLTPAHSQALLDALQPLLARGV